MKQFFIFSYLNVNYLIKFIYIFIYLIDCCLTCGVSKYRIQTSILPIIKIVERSFVFSSASSWIITHILFVGRCCALFCFLAKQKKKMTYLVWTFSVGQIFTHGDALFQFNMHQKSVLCVKRPLRVSVSFLTYWKCKVY